jgi:hypothetical protein
MAPYQKTNAIRSAKWHAEPKLALARPAFALSGFGAAAFARCASEGWWAWEDLNFRPHAYQARALTN